MQRYLDDPSSLSTVVAVDAPLLGDVSGLRVAHLQGHTGTDPVSLAASTGADADVVVGSVYDAPALTDPSGTPRGEPLTEPLRGKVPAVCSPWASAPASWTAT